MIQKCPQRLSDESGDLPKRKTADKSETLSYILISLSQLEKKVPKVASFRPLFLKVFSHFQKYTVPTLYCAIEAPISELHSMSKCSSNIKLK